MPRPPRTEFAGAVHHVTARGVVRREIFLDDGDRRRYLEFLGRTVRFTSWRCLSYCLMGNHVHMLIETPRPNLAQGMQRLHGTYGRVFNKRHAGAGHVFQGRYKATLVAEERQLWATVRYIANNPVAARLCRSPEDWPWGSHTLIAAQRTAPWLDTPRLFELLGAGGEPRIQYLDLVKGSDPLEEP